MNATWLAVPSCLKALAHLGSKLCAVLSSQVLRFSLNLSNESVRPGNPSVDLSNCELLPPLPPEPKALTAAPSARPTLAPAPRRPVFNCADRNVLVKYGAGEATRQEGPILEELPSTGTIFWGPKSRGISNHVKKEFKDLGNFIDLSVEMKKTGKNDTVMDSEILGMKIEKAGKNFIVSLPTSDSIDEEEEEEAHDDDVAEVAESPSVHVSSPERKVEKVESKEERIARLETEVESDLLDLRAAVDKEAGCLFCQQCRIVWVEATFLLSHMVVVHQAGDTTNLAIQRIKRLQRETKGVTDTLAHCADVFLLGVKPLYCVLGRVQGSQGASSLFFRELKFSGCTTMYPCYVMVEGPRETKP